MDKINLAYLAGFFDGEGCVCITQRLCYNHYNKKRGFLSYYLFITAAQCGKEGKQICKDFKLCFGGSVRIKQDKKKKHRSSYSWAVVSWLAYRFLKMVYPYLRIKKEEAELAMEFAEKTSSYRGNNCPSEIERIEKFSYYETAKQEMHFLKKV